MDLWCCRWTLYCAGVSTCAFISDSSWCARFWWLEIYIYICSARRCCTIDIGLFSRSCFLSGLNLSQRGEEFYRFCYNMQTYRWDRTWANYPNFNFHYNCDSYAFFARSKCFKCARSKKSRKVDYDWVIIIIIRSPEKALSTDALVR